MCLHVWDRLHETQKAGASLAGGWAHMQDPGQRALGCELCGPQRLLYQAHHGRHKLAQERRQRVPARQR